VADPTEYVLARLQEAFTHDPRVHEQSIEARVEGARIVLRGELATPERCQAAINVAKELFPDSTVVADLRASPNRLAAEPEQL